MEVIDELIAYLRHRGVLTAEHVEQLTQAGFNVTDSRFDDPRDDDRDPYYDDFYYDPYYDDDFYDDWREPEQTSDAIDVIEDRLAVDTHPKRSGAKRNPTLQARLEEEFLQRLHEDVAAAEEFETFVATLMGGSYGSDIDPAEIDEAMGTAVCRGELILPEIWRHIAPGPLHFEEQSSRASTLFVELVQDGRSASVPAMRLAARMVVQHGIRLVRAYNAVTGAFGRLVAGMDARELGKQLAYDFDPRLYEVLLILHNAWKPPVTIGDLFEAGAVHLPLQATDELFDDDRWDFAARIDPVGVLRYKRWCIAHWVDDVSNLRASLRGLPGGTVNGCWVDDNLWRGARFGVAGWRRVAVVHDRGTEPAGVEVFEDGRETFVGHVIEPLYGWPRARVQPRVEHGEVGNTTDITFLRYIQRPSVRYKWDVICRRGDEHPLLTCPPEWDNPWLPD